MNKYDEGKIKAQQDQYLKALIDYAGGQARLAKHMNVSNQVVYAWLKRGRISATCAIEAERLTKGFITKEELRPDVINWIGE